METLRKRLEISLHKAMKISMLLLLTILMLSPYCTIAQDSAIRQIRVKDENGTPRLRKVEFWNTQKNIRLRTLDLIEENPFNSMGWPRKGGNFDTRQYDLSGKIVSDFVPKEVIAGYSPEMRRPDWPLFGASVYYEISFDNPDFLLVNYHANFILDESQGGELNCLKIFNKEGKEIKTFPKYDRNASDLGISNDGKYITHIFYSEGVEGFLYPEGFRILDIEKNKYFHLETGSGFKMSLITRDEAYLYRQKSINKKEYQVDLFRFDLQKGKYFHQTLTFLNEEQKREDLGYSDIITMIEKFYKARTVPEEPMVWKDFEPYW